MEKDTCIPTQFCRQSRYLFPPTEPPPAAPPYVGSASCIQLRLHLPAFTLGFARFFCISSLASVAALFIVRATKHTPDAQCVPGPLHSRTTRNTTTTTPDTLTRAAQRQSLDLPCVLVVYYCTPASIRQDSSVLVSNISLPTATLDLPRWPFGTLFSLARRPPHTHRPFFPPQIVCDATATKEFSPKPPAIYRRP